MSVRLISLRLPLNNDMVMRLDRGVRLAFASCQRWGLSGLPDHSLSFLIRPLHAR